MFHDQSEDVYTIVAWSSSASDYEPASLTHHAKCKQILPFSRIKIRKSSWYPDLEFRKGDRPNRVWYSG